jgi:hypothetical protein
MKRLSDLLSVRDAGQLASRGGQDSITLHINPREAATVIPLLKAMGGSGRPNPFTGGINFDDDGDNTSSSSMESDDGGWDSGYVSDSDAIAGLGQEGGATGVYGGPAAGEPGNMAGGWNLSEGRFNSQEEQDALDAANSKAGNEAWQGVFGYDPTVGFGDKGGLGELVGYNPNWQSALPTFGLDQLASWSKDNPWTSTAAQFALTAANPVLGALYGAANAYGGGKGVNAVGSIAGMFNPAAGAAINTGANLYNSGPAGLLNSAAQYGINSNNLNLGQNLNSLFGNDRGSSAAQITGTIGNLGQQSAVGNAVGSLGLGGWSSLVGDSGYGTMEGNDSGNASNSYSSAHSSPVGQSAQRSQNIPINSLSDLLSGGGSSGGYQPFKAYTANFAPAATSAPTDYNAAIAQSPLDIQKLLGQQPAQSIYGQPRRLASMLNQGDYYGD